MTKRALEAFGVPYVLVNLANDQHAVELIKQLGYTSAPVVVDGAASWAGFQPAKITAVATARAIDCYAVPIDPMDELQCDSCQ